MNKKNHTPLYETYNFKCTKCGTRHKAQVEKCFKCGSGKDKVLLDKITKKQKQKSAIRGGTLTIKI